jgi:hypothetical protein
MKLRPPQTRAWRWLALAALLLAACGPQAAAPTAVASTPSLAPALVSTTAPTAAAAEPTVPGAEPAATEPVGAPGTEAAPTALAEPTLAPPTATAFVISDEFTPTDPATVNLAAGQPQLVEFFAFW